MGLEALAFRVSGFGFVPMYLCEPGTRVEFVPMYLAWVGFVPIYHYACRGGSYLCTYALVGFVPMYLRAVSPGRG